MKNGLLQQGDCLKYWEKYGRNTSPYPLAPRSGTEALPPAPPSSSRPGRRSAKRFSYSWAKAVSNNRAFLQLAQSPPWDFGTVRVRSAWSKNTPILWGGEKKGSVCLQLAPPALRSLDKPGFFKASACWGDFFLLKLFFFVSERGAHGKVRQEIEVVFPRTTAAGLCVVYGLPCHPPTQHLLLPGGSLVKQWWKATCLLYPVVRCLPVLLPAPGGTFPPSGVHGDLGGGGPSRASPAPCPGKG